MASRERARRRAQRLAEAAARRQEAERRELRRRRLRRWWPRLPDRRTGRTFLRRTRAERAGIAVLAGLVIALVWYAVGPLPLRVGLTALLLLGLPAFVIIALDRRC